MTSIANPLRFPGLARIAAGIWFIVSGAGTLRQYGDLAPQAQRVFYGEMGRTDFPIRSLLMLVTAGLLILIGVVIITKGLRWLVRVQFSSTGPMPLDRADVIATLTMRQPPAFGDGPSRPYRLLQRLLEHQLGDMPWWRRELMGRGVRTFVRACALIAAIAVLFFVLPYMTYLDLLGPFPTSFVLVLLFVTGVWAVLGLMLIPSDSPRIESFQFTAPNRINAVDIIETPPELLDRESPWPGVMLGVAGVGVQCLMPTWWKFPFTGSPLLATSLIRLAGTTAGGVAFLLLGGRMMKAAADVLMSFRYGSTLVYFDRAVDARIGYAAHVRTVTRGSNGPRQIVAAVASLNVREEVEGMMEHERRVN